MVSLVNKRSSLPLSEEWGQQLLTICVPLFVALLGKESTSEGFVGKVFDWLKKRFFTSEFIFTFKVDVCMEPTCAATCFIHFVMSHRSDNIRLIFSFFQLKCILVGFSSQVLYVFICFASEWA